MKKDREHGNHAKRGSEEKGGGFGASFIQRLGDEIMNDPPQRTALSGCVPILSDWEIDESSSRPLADNHNGILSDSNVAS